MKTDSTRNHDMSVALQNDITGDSPGPRGRDGAIGAS